MPLLCHLSTLRENHPPRSRETLSEAILKEGLVVGSPVLCVEEEGGGGRSDGSTQGDQSDHAGTTTTRTTSPPPPLYHHTHLSPRTPSAHPPRPHARRHALQMLAHTAPCSTHPEAAKFPGCLSILWCCCQCVYTHNHSLSPDMLAATTDIPLSYPVLLLPTSYTHTHKFNTTISPPAVPDRSCCKITQQ